MPVDLIAIGATLDAIEAELKRLGWWDEAAPSLVERYDRGALRTYLDAPSFEAWLQGVFLPRARAALTEGAYPRPSQVGLMALRQYDYHSLVPEAQPLLALLHRFDALSEGRTC
ncbi:MAG TPA: YqcC family protein [Rubricoccaceae bacterium]|nr:YqcC family protein [Rubricoccaceae bacterium]